MTSPLMKDARWVRQAFNVNSSDLYDQDLARRTFSTASLKYTDTTPGGNFAINPPPQFTRYADPKPPSLLSGGKGMGRYYSEAIDDNSQIIHMRFGVPQFNSLTTFFTGFYNTGAGQLARTGRSTGAFYALGKAATFIVSIMTWQLLAVQILGMALRFGLQKPSSKFYYLKPAMPLYWNAVTTIVNQIAVNRGIVPRIGGADQDALNNQYEFDAAGLETLSKLLPDIFKKGGGIDVYAMANRAQRLARQQNKNIQAGMDVGGLDNAAIAAKMNTLSTAKLTDQKPDYETYLQRWFSTTASSPDVTSEKTSEIARPDAAPVDTPPPSGEKKNDVEDPSWWSFLSAELDDGAAFASFRVNSTGATQESFSNSVTESELAGKINGMSASSRSTNFSFGGGNMVGGAAGKVIGGVISAAKDFAAGIGDQLEISGLAALGGSAFVDIPKHWQSSSAQLPRANYTINLTSPYGNPISQLINLHVPLAMLLAGALPLSTGKQSYTSPFLVELYDQGRCQTRLGMIDSISITRGTGNLGYNNQGQAMGIDVSFSIIDMSSILHMPISEGFSLAAAATGAVVGAVAGGATGAAAGAAVAGGVFDEDTVFTDYMHVIAGMGLADQIYSYRKLKLNLTQKMADWNSWYSTSHFMSFIGDTGPARLWSAFFKGVDGYSQPDKNNPNKPHG